MINETQENFFNCPQEGNVKNWCYALNDKSIEGCAKYVNDSKDLREICYYLKILVGAKKEKNSSFCDTANGTGKNLCLISMGSDIKSECQKASSISSEQDNCITYFSKIMSDEIGNYSSGDYFTKALMKNNETFCKFAKIYYSGENNTNIFASEVPCRQLLDENYIADCNLFSRDYCNLANSSAIA